MNYFYFYFKVTKWINFGGLSNSECFFPSYNSCNLWSCFNLFLKFSKQRRVTLNLQYFTLILLLWSIIIMICYYLWLCSSWIQSSFTLKFKKQNLFNFMQAKRIGFLRPERTKWQFEVDSILRINSVMSFHFFLTAKKSPIVVSNNSLFLKWNILHNLINRFGFSQQQLIKY